MVFLPYGSTVDGALPAMTTGGQGAKAVSHNGPETTFGGVVHGAGAVREGQVRGEERKKERKKKARVSRG